LGGRGIPAGPQGLPTKVVENGRSLQGYLADKKHPPRRALQ